MTTQEIEERKKELAEQIENAKTVEEVEELRKAVDDVKEQVPEEEPKAEEVQEEVAEEVATEEPKEISEEEERKLIRVNAEQIVPIGNFKEERKMNKYDIETRAWAKKCLGNELTEEETRALGDAVGTTATTFVASAANTQGINNVGLYIPTSVRLELEERAMQESPIYRDARKLRVNGNVNVPYLYAADDAAWYAELVNTANEGQEHKAIVLTGQELAKNVVITWKVDQMTPEGFIDFIIDELYEKMYKAKVNAIVYGLGASSNQPAGLTLGLTPVTTGATPVDTIANTKATLSEKAKVGAKVYVSPAVADAIKFYKNQEGNYPFLAGLPTDIEKDDFLKNNDIVVGNMRNYVWNEQEEIRIDRDPDLTKRVVTYSAYQVCDGGAKVGAFAYGKYTPSV